MLCFPNLHLNSPALWCGAFLYIRGGTRRRGATAFYARRFPALHPVPHRAATARRLGQALHRTLYKRQTVQVGCRDAGYLRACVALKPSGGAGLSKGQRGNIRKFPLAPWKRTPLQKPTSFLHALWLMPLIPLPMCSEKCQTQSSHHRDAGSDTTPPPHVHSSALVLTAFCQEPQPSGIIKSPISKAPRNCAGLFFCLRQGASSSRISPPGSS